MKTENQKSHKSAARKPAIEKYAGETIEAGGSNKKTIIMASVLGILIVIAAIQSIALFDLNNKVDTKIEKIPKASSTITTGASSSESGPDGSNLPTMVGGC